MSADLRLNEPRYATLPNIMVMIDEFLISFFCDCFCFVESQKETNNKTDTKGPGC